MLVGEVEGRSRGLAGKDGDKGKARRKAAEWRRRIHHKEGIGCAKQA